MSLEELADRLDVQIRNGIRVEWNDIAMSDCNSDEYKQGVYYVFDYSNTIIYIGMVGDGDDTSLYHRYAGHGWGAVEDAKRVRSRIEAPVYVLFQRFSHCGCTNEQLHLVKRILLWKIKPVGSRIPSGEALRKDIGKMCSVENIVCSVDVG